MENEQLLQALSDMMDKKLEPINSRLDSMDNRLDSMDSRLDSMDSRLDSMDSRLDGMDSRMDGMDSRLDKLESQVSALRAGQLEMQKEIREINLRVSQTNQIALDAWGTSIENRKWLENVKKSS